MGDLTKGFLRYEFGWGAYIWRGLFSEFYGISKLGLGVLLVHMIKKKRWKERKGEGTPISLLGALASTTVTAAKMSLLK